MLLLPLFENAIKHGPSAGRAGTVTFAARAVQADVAVEIRNPGTFGGPRPGGEGITSVERRLALSYGGDVKLEIESVGDETTVRLRVPMRPTIVSRNFWTPSSAPPAKKSIMLSMLIGGSIVLSAANSHWRT